MLRNGPAIFPMISKISEVAVTEHSADIPRVNYVEYSFLTAASYLAKDAMPHIVGNEIIREHPVHLIRVSLCRR